MLVCGTDDGGVSPAELWEGAGARQSLIRGKEGLLGNHTPGLCCQTAEPSGTRISPVNSESRLDGPERTRPEKVPFGGEVGHVTEHKMVFGSALKDRQTERGGGGE